MKCISRRKGTCQQLCAVIWKYWLPGLLCFIEICKTLKPRKHEFALLHKSRPPGPWCGRRIRAVVQGAFPWQSGFIFPSSADSTLHILRQVTSLLALLSMPSKHWWEGRGNQAEVFCEWRIGFPWHNAWDHWHSLKNQALSSPQHELAMVIFASGAVSNKTAGQIWAYGAAFSNIGVFL